MTYGSICTIGLVHSKASNLAKLRWIQLNLLYISHDAITSTSPVIGKQQWACWRCVLPCLTTIEMPFQVHIGFEHGVGQPGTSSYDFTTLLRWIKHCKHMVDWAGQWLKYMCMCRAISLCQAIIMWYPTRCVHYFIWDWLIILRNVTCMEAKGLETMYYMQQLGFFDCTHHSQRFPRNVQQGRFCHSHHILVCLNWHITGGDHWHEHGMSFPVEWIRILENWWLLVFPDEWAWRCRYTLPQVSGKGNCNKQCWDNAKHQRSCDNRRVGMNPWKKQNIIAYA